MNALHANLAPVQPVLVVVVNDPWHMSEPGGRVLELRDHTGGPVRDYLPPETAGFTDADLVVSINGRPVSDLAWDIATPAPGDCVNVIPRVAAAETIIIGVVYAVVIIAGVLVAMDEVKRAKIQLHHASRRAAAAAAMLDGSAIYGWNGVQNTTEPGRSIPILLGRHLVGGQIVYAEPREGLQSKLLDMVIVISQGECLGPVSPNSDTGHSDVTENALINGATADKFAGVTMDFRVGAVGQSAMDKILPTKVPRDTVLNGKHLTVGGTDTYITQPDRTHITMQFRASTGIWYTGAKTESWHRCWVTMRWRQRAYPAGSFGGWTTVTHFTKCNNSGYSVPGGFQVALQPIQWTIKTLNSPKGRYEFEVELTSVTFAQGGGRTFDATNTKLVFAEVQEFNEARSRYLGTAVVGITALASESLGGIPPTVTTLWDGMKLRVYSDTSTYTTEFTRNPSWQILNILGNDDWGGGGRLEWDKDFDKQSFIDAALFCDELVARLPVAREVLVSESGNGHAVGGTNIFRMTTSNPSRLDTVRVDDILVGAATATYPGGFEYAIDSIVNSGTVTVREVDPSNTVPVAFSDDVGGDWSIKAREKRFLSDFYIDDQTDLWEASHAVARNARCAIAWVNGKIALIPDQAGEVVQVITPDLIVPGSIKREYRGLKGTANVFEGQFLNAEKDYEQDVVRYEDPSVFANGETPVPARVAIFGCTSHSQALRTVIYQALSNRLERNTLSLKVPSAGLALLLFDRVRISDDLLPFDTDIAAQSILDQRAHKWPAAVVVSSTATTVTFDRDVYLDANYQLITVQSAATDGIFGTTISPTITGWTRTVTVGSWGIYTPVAGDLVLMTHTPTAGDTPYDYKVVEIIDDGEGMRELKFVPYDETLFTLSDVPDELPTYEVD